MFPTTIAKEPNSRGGKHATVVGRGAGSLKGLECIDLIITGEVTFRLTN